MLICDASGRPPAATGRDRTGQVLPRPQRDYLDADFPMWRSSLMVHLSRYNIVGDRASKLFVKESGFPWSPGDTLLRTPKRGGFLDEYPKWHASMRRCLTNHEISPDLLDSWDPRFDDLRFASLRGGEPPLQVTATCLFPHGTLPPLGGFYRAA